MNDEERFLLQTGDIGTFGNFFTSAMSEETTEKIFRVPGRNLIEPTTSVTPVGWSHLVSLVAWLGCYSHDIWKKSFRSFLDPLPSNHHLSRSVFKAIPSFVWPLVRNKLKCRRSFARGVFCVQIVNKHIAAIDGEIAQDLIKNGVMKRQECRNLQTRKLQRFYVVRLALISLLFMFPDLNESLKDV